MRFSIQACIQGEGLEPSRVITVGVVDREDDFAPASGLGLFMREAHELLEKLQTVLLNGQVDKFVDASARCLACGTRLGIKDTKRLVYRTTFGKASLRSPRYYSHCSACGFCASDKATVSPLAHRAAATYSSPVELAPVPIRQRDVISLGTDLSARCISRGTSASEFECQGQRACRWESS
jgi:hypothetical protein